MARIFTVDFVFKGMQHVAVVSAWKGEAQSYVVQVALYDDGLQDLVPGGVVRFSTADDSVVQTSPQQAELVYCLKQVVAGHLQNLLYKPDDYVG